MIYRCFVIAFFMLLYISPVVVNAAYVSERLFLSIYASPRENASLVKTLPSGSEVEILEEEGEFVRIRAANDVEGWAKAEFITEQTPASLTIKQITQQRDQLQAQLNAIGVTEQTVKRLQRQLATANRQIKNLNKDIEDKQSTAQEQAEQQKFDQTAQLQLLYQELEESEQATLVLADENKALKSKLRAAGGNTHDTLTKIAWLLLSMSLCLVLGILLGIGWLARRVRRRFNGRKVW